MAKRHRKKPGHKKYVQMKKKILQQADYIKHQYALVSTQRKEYALLQKRYDQVVDKITQIQPYSVLLPPKLQQCEYTPYRVQFTRHKFTSGELVSPLFIEEELHHHIMCFLDVEFQEHPESQRVHFIARIQNEDGYVKSGAYASIVSHVDQYKVNYLAERIAKELQKFLNSKKDKMVHHIFQ